MAPPRRRPWFENLADPIYAALIGVTQAVAWFVVHGEKHGFPQSRSEALDAALFATIQLGLPLALCFAFRLVLARGESR
jgi:hypothetical protein